MANSGSTMSANVPSEQKETNLGDNQGDFKDFPNPSTPSVNDPLQPHSDSTSLYGLSKQFFREIFLPKATSFQNDIFDISVEHYRFVCLPYYFPEEVAKK